MIIAQRKHHFYYWLGIAFLLPLAMLMAYQAIPEWPPQESLPQEVPVAFTNILDRSETSHCSYLIREDSNSGQRQLEVILKAPLSKPSAVVYLSSQVNINPKGQDQAMGLLGGRELYRFSLDSLQAQSNQYQVYLFDQISQETFAEASLNL